MIQKTNKNIKTTTTPTQPLGVFMVKSTKFMKENPYLIENQLVVTK